MRWCANNCICRLLYRHLPFVVIVTVLLLSANQVIHFSKEKTAVCYKILSPSFVKQHQLSFNSTTHNRHHYYHQRSSSNSDLSNDTDVIVDPFLPNVDWSQGRFDDRRILRIYEWAWTGTLWSNLTATQHACLATQGSIDRIASIGEVSEKWLGPISLAIYVRRRDEFWILTIFTSYMRRCSLIFSQTVSIHLVVPMDFDKPDISNQSFYFDLMNEEYPCDQPHQFMSNLMSKLLFQEPQGLYPQNHMRNVARKTCPTSWILMTDVDIIPRPNASSLLTTFFKSIQNKCTKCAFVIPVFELDKSMPYPSSKKELIKHVNKGLARQFHLKIYRYGHWATNYSTWQATNLEEEPIKISHLVDNKLNHYEPFYVSSDAIPKHDERFVGYGFTRSSQVLEARMMGWKFVVLTPIFAIHWGLQTPQSIRSHPIPISLHAIKPGSGGGNKAINNNANNNNNKAINQAKTSRRAQNLRNHVIYTDFVSELMAKYNISASRKSSQRKQHNNHH